MKSLILTIGLLAALAPRSESQVRTPPFQAVAGAFFAVSVPNLAESVQWYSEKLGLSVSLQASYGGIDVTALEGGGLIVELLRDPSAQPRGVARPEQLHGFFKAGFSVKDFANTVTELRARGVEIIAGPFPQRDDQKANLIIRDNAGNLIQIFGHGPEVETKWIGDVKKQKLR